MDGQNLDETRREAGKRRVGGQAITFVDVLEADTGVPRDCLPAAMNDRFGWRKRAIGVG